MSAATSPDKATNQQQEACSIIETLQLSGNYDEIRTIAQHAISAILNDDEPLRLCIPHDVSVRYLVNA
jgi:hypothetical protein